MKLSKVTSKEHIPQQAFQLIWYETK